MDRWFGSLVNHDIFALLCFVATLLAAQEVKGNALGDVFEKKVGFKQRNQNRRCDFSQGSWVKDDSYPLYNEKSCPFIGFNCLNNGRPDKDYLQYRWKPNGCDLPRFDGRDFLERYRGKKIMFVGDSLSNNMWQSLTCMLYMATPHSNYTLSTTKLLSEFSLPDYGLSVMFLKNGFLVDMVYEKDMGKVLKLDSISSAKQWIGVDMLIFNTFHWWTHSGRSKTWDYFQVGNKVVKEMDRMLAFRTALTTWAKWVNSNIDPSKTIVFYQGVSAVHQNGTEWNDPKAKNCNGQTQPVMGSKYPGTTSHPGEEIVKSVLSSLRDQAYLLDITLLTQLRKDGHPSIYATKDRAFVDCSHWCLPGVPDTWNEILYAVLLNSNILL
ncbi:protein trichome birefringence-like 42 [Morus notabilis]|nr:protein trichome birefringence-like 42 [Morus notabilis]